MRRVTGVLLFVISAAWGADAGPNRIRDAASTALALIQSTFLSGLDKAVQYTEIIDPALSDGYLLLAAHAAGVALNLTTAVYARHIALRQQPDGRCLAASFESFRSAKVPIQGSQLNFFFGQDEAGDRSIMLGAIRRCVSSGAYWCYERE